MKSIDFDSFDTRFLGYVCVHGDTIHIPAIMAKTPGRGHLTSLLIRLKKKYRRIQFNGVLSPRLAVKLAREGFLMKEVLWLDEKIICFEWRNI